VAEQLALLGSKLVGVTVNVGVGGGAVQLHATFTGLTPVCPEKVKVPFWQGIDPMLTVTGVPGETAPLDGLKVTLLPRSVVTDQFTVPPCALRVTLHWEVLPVAEQLELVGSKLVGVTVSVGVGGGGVQLHATFTGVTPVCPEKVKVPFWQGIVPIVTVTGVPGETVPLAGLKVTPLPRSLLADQVTVPPCAFSVTLHW